MKSSYRIVVCLFSLLPYLCMAQNFVPQIPLSGHPQAHAHNDYEHDFPLWEALHYGFTSVEADVWLINDKLYVKHFKPKNLRKTPTLKSLYLAPLDSLLRERGGKVYPEDSHSFYLMIDIKSEAVSTYEALVKELKHYESTLAHKDSPLIIFLSGSRPLEHALGDKNSFLAIDGRPEDLGKAYSVEFMPVISQRYGKITHWKGKSKISRKEFRRVKKLADACHAEGKKLRLWASPETEICWKTLLKAGVDFINTDKLEKLDNFLKTRHSKE